MHHVGDIHYKTRPNGSVPRDRKIVCDHPGCNVEIARPSTSRTNIEQRARYEGWQIGKQHLCPHHRTTKTRVKNYWWKQGAADVSTAK